MKWPMGSNIVPGLCADHLFGCSIFFPLYKETRVLGEVLYDQFQLNPSYKHLAYISWWRQIFTKRKLLNPRIREFGDGMNPFPYGTVL